MEARELTRYRKQKWKKQKLLPIKTLCIKVQVTNDMRRFLLAIFFLKATVAFTQNADNGLSKKLGIIVFEDKFDMYFIETSKTNLAALMKTDNDTITAYMLYTTDGASNFKQYLNQKFKFDSASFIIKQDYQVGKYVFDTANLFWKYGYVEYVESKSYKLEKRYKTLYLNGKALTIALEDYMPIEMFSAEAFKKPKKKKYKMKKSR
jgi:hypothetical protein